ncbi:MAG: nuclease-related domain-containing protein [Ruminococcus callidus]
MPFLHRPEGRTLKWLAASGKKGIQGEKQVARRLRRLDSRQYIVLSDLLLPCGSRLTQIDHVVVSVYGIFVIETKNYHGTISGSIWKEFWVQECHGRQYDLRNPFRQNYAHVQALASLLGLERDCFFSVVAFADDAVLQVVQPEDSTRTAGAYFQGVPCRPPPETAPAAVGRCPLLRRRDFVCQHRGPAGTGTAPLPDR